MLKKKLIFMSIVLFMFGLVISSFAEMECAEHPSGGDKHSSAAPTKQTSTPLVAQAQNVGNKICPVMGNPIAEDPKVTYEYEGKIYNFCCESCIEEFKANPEKYIKIIEQEKNK